MRAAVLTGPGRLRIEEAVLPSPGPGQVRVRLEGCGVCASNLAAWAGPDWMRYPTEPGSLGHEGWGVGEAVAPGRLDPDPLYTHRFPLDRLDEALDAARDRPDGFLKALVTLA